MFWKKGNADKGLLYLHDTLKKGEYTKYPEPEYSSPLLKRDTAAIRITAAQSELVH